jgi:hypothetical protein
LYYVLVLKIIRITKTCIASPTQWEGVDAEQRHIYIRYRHGFLGVYLGSVNGDADSAVFGEEVFGQQIGKKYDGVLEYEQLKKATKSIIEFPEIEE